MRTLTRANWESTTSAPPLPAEQLHVWRVALEETPCRLEWLDTVERQRLDAMSGAVLRQRHCATRTALRRLLGLYLGMPPNAIGLEIGAHGKPALARGEQRLRFNLSHCGGLALIAFCRDREVGIDLESVREISNLAGIARRVMSDTELRELQADKHAPVAFMRLWTRMEARQKCLGQGVFGERVDEREIGIVSFEPADNQVASVAWSNPSATPRPRYFSLELMKP